MLVFGQGLLVRVTTSLTGVSLVASVGASRRSGVRAFVIMPGGNAFGVRRAAGAGVCRHAVVGASRLSSHLAFIAVLMDSPGFLRFGFFRRRFCGCFGFVDGGVSDDLGRFGGGSMVVVMTAVAASEHTDDHHQSEQNSKNLLHGVLQSFPAKFFRLQFLGHKTLSSGFMKNKSFPELVLFSRIR